MITLAALLTTACASSKRVVVEKQGIDEAQYQQDLSDYRAVADEVSTGRGGAVIGGILGAIFGNSGTAGRMAGGGVIGAAGKAGDAEQEKSQVVKNCMRGRGYRVLN
ncbi:glycine zipper family protein [Alloalcanivorax venustensis]|uniref:glycine zipper family protein n=1 Tax=Alloalcanivorax venustensis TaxID=172371 RepID=UPI0039E3AC72